MVTAQEIYLKLFAGKEVTVDVTNLAGFRSLMVKLTKLNTVPRHLLELTDARIVGQFKDGQGTYRLASPASSFTIGETDAEI